MATYSAGTATVDVIPSLKGFHSTLRRELKGITPDVTIGVTADTKRATQKIRDAVKVPTVQLKVEANKAALKKAEADVAAAEKRIAAAKDANSDATKRLEIAEKALAEVNEKKNKKASQIAAAELKLAQAKRAATAATNDQANAESSLNAARDAARDAKVKLETEVDTTTASGKLQAFAQRAGEKYRIKLGVDPDLTGAAAALATFKATASRAAKIQANVDLDVGAALAKLTMLSAAGSSLGFAAAGGIGLIGAGLVAIPGAAAVAVGGLATVAVGVQGIGDALKAFQAAEDQAAQNATANAKAHQSAARQIVSARNQVSQAQTSLSRAYEDASASQVAAARRVQDAERQVIDAERARLQAQQALTRAVDDARRAQQELAFQVAGGALAERQAVLDVADAQAELEKARASGVSGDALERVQLAYERQVLSLEELKARNANLATDKKASDAAGVQGSDQVVSAQERVAQANQAVVDSQQGVRDAQAESARVQIQSQRSIADAQLAVAQAQTQLVQAIQDAGTVGAAATDKIAAAMAKLSPAGQEFVNSIRSLGPEFHTFKKSVQEALFSGLGPAFADFARSTLPAMGANLGMVAGAINGVTKDMLGFLATKDVADQFGALFGLIGQVITAVGPVVQTFVKLFLDLAVAAMPGILALVEAFGVIGTSLADAFKPLIESGAITTAVTLIAGVITALAPVLGIILSLAVQLWNAIGPALISVIQTLTPVIQQLAGLFVEMAPILGEIVMAIASALMPVVQALAPVIAALMPIIASLIDSALAILVPLIRAAADIFMAFMPAIQAVVAIIAELVPVIAPLIAQLAMGLLPLVRALTPVIVQLAAIIAQGLTAALTTLIPFVLQVIQALLPMIPVISSIIAQVVSGLLPIFIPLTEAFLGLILAVVPLLPPLLQLVDALLPAIISLIGTLMPIITILASIFTNVLAAVINNVVLPALQIFVAVIKTLAGIIKFLYDVVIKPIWEAIGAIIDFVWSKVIKPAFDTLTSAVGSVGDVFEKMGDKISGIWAGLKKVVHGGIQGIVDLVYNNGIRKLVNAVVQYVPFLSELPEIKVPEFAEGGVLPGYAPGRDTVPAMLSPGEAVLVPELVRAIGPAAILAANAAAMRGRGYSRGGVVGFADGGVVTNAASTGAAAITIDPATLAGLGDVATAVTAQLEKLTLTVIAVAASVVTVLDPAIRLLSATIVNIANLALLELMRQMDATAARQNLLAQQMTTSWTLIQDVTNGSVQAQNQAMGALQNAMAQTRQAIAFTADWAVSQWDRIRAAAADPIRWAIQYPFNAGLIAAWNTIDGQFSLGKHVDPIALAFAAGGHVRGPGTATSDSIPALLSNNEFVIRAAVAKRTLPFLRALNDGDPEALQATGARRFAGGGLVADTGSQLSAAILRGMRFAKDQDGKPYIWGGVGPEGFDCSGYMSAITNVLRGEDNPYRRLGVARSQPWPGFVPGLSSAFATGFSDVHTAGTLGGINVESGGSPSRVKFGIGAVGADSAQFGGHASLPIVGGKFQPGGGGIDFAALIGPHFADTYRLIGQLTTLFAGNHMAGQAGGVATRATDGVKNAALSALTAMASVTAGAGSPEVTAAVRSVAARFGWGEGSEWNALSQLISHESGWNPNAANPTSSARGLFQKMTSVNGPLEATVAGQAEWGLNYIKGRYGSPGNAWAAWQSRSPHWYDQGGVANGIGWMYKGTPEPERVLSPAQTRAFDTLVASVSTGARTGFASTDNDGHITGTFRLEDRDGVLVGIIDGRIEHANDENARALDRGTRT